MAAEVTLDDRYVLDARPLTRGGMGEIWAARDRRLGRDVIVKLIRPAEDELDAELVRRFQREARLTAQLEHPGVPAVYDFGTHAGRLYLVLQRIRGINISDLHAEQAPLPVDWVTIIGAQVSSVLIAAHDAGTIHRDIKPGNLMLDRSGAVKVLDFGLAAALGRSDLSRITRSDQVIGTPAYMAPEQITGEAITPQTDIYGLGSTLYDLLTGQPPFPAPSSHAMLHQHLSADPVSPRQLRGDISEPLENLVLAMLEKRPEDRPASATEVYGALAALAGDTHALNSAGAAGVDPTRAYLILCGRIPANEAGGAQLAEAAIDRAQLKQAHRQAEEMVAASRLSSVRRLLGPLIEPAVRTFGRTDDEVINLRAIYADALQQAGSWRAAAREHRHLAQDIADRRDDPDAVDERELAHRLQAARAHVMMGETSRARNQLRNLLEDHARIYGDDHPAVRELRLEMEQLDSHH